jgi:glutaminyl-tRNA synthetase
MTNPTENRPPNFIEQIIDADNTAGRWGAWAQPDAGAGSPGKARLGKPRVHTRFPPEPNGYLHIGHAKSICLNFGLAKKYDGKFNLRFDDTNPAKEEQEYVDAIKADVKWLGADFDASAPHGGGIYWASDLFERMYGFAEELITKGKAYVCELSADEVSKRRGTPQIPATSPFRDRPIAESLARFREMRDGKHANGTMTLRAKIDLGSPNFNLRDPVMYRILHEEHHNTGKTWCIYPMYDWAHGFEDSHEGITHSICTLEFENHRPLYDWFIDAVNEGRSADAKIHHSQQIEFAKLQLTYTVLSKRNLLKMVQDRIVSGWDDPRMPTISGIRRRGFTPESIRSFCDEVGVTKTESLIDLGRLENACRDHLNKVAPRYMGVLRPLRVIIDNWDEGRIDDLDCINNPEDPAAGSRKVPFTREIYIERDDFMEDPPKKFFRLGPGREVRLRWAYFLTCTGVEKDASGNITALHATIDPATRGGDSSDGRKVKGTIHWVSATHAKDAQVRLFDRLFKAERPGDATGNWIDDLNPASLEVLTAKIEPAAAILPVATHLQFERLGYFIVDKDSTDSRRVFNRTVTLKDAWAKEAAKA